MLERFIADRIRQELPFEPNAEKEQLMRLWGEFLTDRDHDTLFLLRGYAGTGKTTMISALVRALDKLHQKTVLLAPTGRAAKVISSYSGFPAYTIHKRIYRQRTASALSINTLAAGESVFSLAENRSEHTLFIVDEASMIADSSENSGFGSGRLLDDLIQYVYSNGTCRLMLVGDNAQLPPVGQSLSPALSSDFLSGYGLRVSQYQLTEVARQALESGILANATRLRDMLRQGEVNNEITWQTNGYQDIHVVNGQQMLDELERSYREEGEQETIVVTRSNRRMNLYNQGIRSRLLWKEELLSAGDRIMVTRNNYFFTEQYEGLDFIANGDMLTVVRLRHERELYGYRFADATLRSNDYDWEIEAVVCLDTLLSESPEASYAIQRTLFTRVAEDFPEIHNKRDLTKAVMASPYYNALQIKHAYAVTCHKAQGGQWQRVFIDAGQVAPEQLGEDYYRWFYTALTRAKQQVYILQ